MSSMLTLISFWKVLSSLDQREMREVSESVARELEETVHHGVYAMVGGPHFESVAEVQLLRTLGADVVGE